MAEVDHWFRDRLSYREAIAFVDDEAIKRLVAREFGSRGLKKEVLEKAQLITGDDILRRFKLGDLLRQSELLPRPDIFADSGGGLPPGLLTEVKRLKRVLEVEPTVTLEPFEGLDYERRRILRAYPGMENLVASIDDRETLRTQYQDQREELAKSLGMQLGKISNHIHGLSAWDEQIHDTLVSRAQYWKPDEPILEHRTYVPKPCIVGDKSFVPIWGGFSLTHSEITPKQWHLLVFPLHLQFRTFAEQFLARLILITADLNQGNQQVIDSINRIIVGHEFRAIV